MLSQPLQNSDMFHRTEVASSISTRDSQAQAANLNHVVHQQKKLAEEQANSVDATEKLDLDPNNLSDQRKREEARKRKKRKEEQEPESIPQKNSRRQLGAGHIDFTA